jgi:hypothetical protein
MRRRKKEKGEEKKSGGKRKKKRREKSLPLKSRVPVSVPAPRRSRTRTTRSGGLRLAPGAGEKGRQ